MSRAIHHNCARSYAWTMVVLETGVDRKVDYVFLREPPGE